jgi:hypothetical protein
MDCLIFGKLNKKKRSLIFFTVAVRLLKATLMVKVYFVELQWQFYFIWKEKKTIREISVYTRKGTNLFWKKETVWFSIDSRWRRRNTFSIGLTMAGSNRRTTRQSILINIVTGSVQDRLKSALSWERILCHLNCLF